MSERERERVRDDDAVAVVVVTMISCHYYESNYLISTHLFFLLLFFQEHKIC